MMLSTVFSAAFFMIALLECIHSQCTGGCCAGFQLEPGFDPERVLDCNIHKSMVTMDCRIGLTGIAIDWFYTTVKEQAGISGTKLQNMPGYSIKEEQAGGATTSTLTIISYDKYTFGGHYWCAMADPPFSPDVKSFVSAIIHMDDEGPVGLPSCNNKLTDFTLSGRRCALSGEPSLNADQHFSHVVFMSAQSLTEDDFLSSKFSMCFCCM